MTTTSNLGITLLEASQSQKEVSINQGFTTLDAIAGASVVDKDLATPPSSPATGALYIVAASPTGAWAGQATTLAYFNQIWNFITPQTGMRMWVKDESLYYQFSGTAWAPGGNGDLNKSTYDPANISQQMAGTTATQTLTNKTISGAANTLTVRLTNDVTGTLPTTNGGTGQTTYTDGQLLIGNSTGNTLTKGTLTAGSGITVTNSSGAITIAATGGGGGGLAAQVSSGRLTLTSGTAVTMSDVTAATTLYFTPFRGNRIALYDGTSTWTTLAFTQLSIAVPSTTNTMYDVFAYNNSGTATLEVLAWTNDIARATALTLQDGVYVKTGATTRRYLGSFRTTGTSGQTEDSEANRYVWNYHNRCLRTMRRLESATTWNYSTGSFRQANGNTANQLNFILGVSEDLVHASAISAVANSTTTLRGVYLSIGLDSTTTGLTPLPFASTIGAGIGSLSMSADVVVSAGRHYLAWLEYGGGADTQTWFGNSQCGLVGSLWG